MSEQTLEKATLGGGCFWCVEAVFEQLTGVHDVVSGYAGGKVPNPTYEQICTGTTQHAEVTQITFDPEIISYETLLEVFWRTHDPTTRNRQGADVGTQYRSIILTHNEEQRRLAEQSKAATDAAHLWPNPIVTEIAPLEQFYPAEAYHQDFYRNNPNYGYCRVVIDPKMRKLRQEFTDKLKKPA